MFNAVVRIDTCHGDDHLGALYRVDLVEGDAEERHVEHSHQHPKQRGRIVEEQLRHAAPVLRPERQVARHALLRQRHADACIAAPHDVTDK